MWETVSKEDENGKTTTAFGRKQFVNDIYKNNFCKYRRTWVRFFLIREVKLHVYILNINYAISVELFTL